jgi:putative ABC transport system permease protein
MGYVDAMKIPVVSGRGFQESDVTGPPVALINQTLARKFFPNMNPIGREFGQVCPIDAAFATISAS